MIDFPCLCGEQYSVPQDMAGESFQCQKCGRLVSVPTLDDLQHIGTDGTYDINAANEPPPPPMQLQPLSEGDEIRRTPLPDADQYDIEEPPARIAPRYDPFTGELIRAHEVIVTPDSPELSKPRTFQPLSKSKFRGELAAIPPYPWIYAFGQLLMTQSMAVMIAMLLLHSLLALTGFMVMDVGFALLFFVPAILLFLCVSLYSTTIQEIGPEGKDHLPTPLRDFDLISEVWYPCIQFSMAAAICFTPAIIADNSPAPPIVAEALAVFGAIFFPAFFITLAVDGVLANLRPDRVLGVIRILGLNYIAVAAGWFAGGVGIVVGMEGLRFSLWHLFSRADRNIELPWFIPNGAVSFFVLWIGLYFSYYACFLLGLLWRKHHTEFPWVAQRFKKELPPFATPPTRAPREEKPAAAASTHPTGTTHGSSPL